MQVASKEMPLNAFILGIDLDPIKPIKGCRSIVGDITTNKARAVRSYLVTNQGYWEYNQNIAFLQDFELHASFHILLQDLSLFMSWTRTFKLETWDPRPLIFVNTTHYVVIPITHELEYVVLVFSSILYCSLIELAYERYSYAVHRVWWILTLNLVYDLGSSLMSKFYEVMTPKPCEWSRCQKHSAHWIISVLLDSSECLEANVRRFNM